MLLNIHYCLLSSNQKNNVATSFLSLEETCGPIKWQKFEGCKSFFNLFVSLQNFRMVTSPLELREVRHWRQHVPEIEHGVFEDEVHLATNQVQFFQRIRLGPQQLEEQFLGVLWNHVSWRVGHDEVKGLQVAVLRNDLKVFARTFISGKWSNKCKVDGLYCIERKWGSAIVV